MSPERGKERREGDKEIISSLIEYFDEKDAVREEALKLSRCVIRLSSSAVRATHRGELSEAREYLREARENISRIKSILDKHQDVRYAGFVDDAEQEFAEASVLFSLIFEDRMPLPEELDVEPVSYLNGLGDVTGELRRSILELIRSGSPEKGEVLLEIMEEIYDMLQRFDYPEALTRGLRRKTDLARSMLEKTRGDLTNAIQMKNLERHLSLLEDKLKDTYPNL